MGNRPVGVVVACLALGILALGSLLFTATSLLASLNADSLLASSEMASISLSRILVVTAGMFGLISLWAGLTLFGLFRMQPWARYSILLIGGLLALLGITSALGIALGAFGPAALLQAAPPASAQAAPLPAHTMQRVLLFAGLFYSLLAGIGVWWLIYFNLRATRQAFQLHTHPAQRAEDNAVDRAQSQSGTRSAFAQANRPPFSVIVIACFFLTSAFACVISGFLPFPAFVLGATLHGSAEHMLYAVCAVGSAVLGVGLLRLRNPARLATFAVMGFGVVNLLLMPTPFYRAGLESYTRELNRQMGLPPTAVSVSVPSLEPTLLLGALTGILLYAAAAWVLHRHRHLFR
jgi:hypothetical protein